MIVDTEDRGEMDWTAHIVELLDTEGEGASLRLTSQGNILIVDRLASRTYLVSVVEV